MSQNGQDTVHSIVGATVTIASAIVGVASDLLPVLQVLAVLVAIGTGTLTMVLTVGKIREGRRERK